MGDDAKAVDTYAKMFNVTPETIRKVLGSGAPIPTASSAPSGPAPGDPGFASTVLGAPPSAPMARPPAGPAPGDPGFGLDQIGSMGSPAAPRGPAPGPSKAPPAFPTGAGQIDTSGIVPKGFSSGAVTIPNLPSGAGQVNLSGITPPNTSTPPPAPQGGAPAAAPGAGGVFVPGGWQHASRGDQVQHGIDPTKLEQGQYFRDVASGHGQLAADKQLEAASMQGSADAAYAAAHQQAAQQALDEQRRIDNERKAYVQAEHAKLNDLSVAANQKVDPDAAKGSSGAQLMAAIGVALGQYGASITGGTNAALQLVQSNIDRNIHAQETNIANAGKAHDREQSLYHQNLQAFGDRDQAVAATKMQMLDQAKAIADQTYANAKGSLSEAQYHATIEGINNAKAAAADQFTSRTEDKVTSESHDAYHGPSVLGGAATGEAKHDAHGYSEDLEKAGIPAQLAGLQDLDQRIDTMGSGDVPGLGYFKDKLPAFALSSEGVANRQAVQSLKNNIGHAKFGGALSPTEADKLDRELEGAHDAASLRNVVQSFRRTLSNRQRNIAAGYSPDGRALYEARGGSVHDVKTNEGTTPHQRAVKDDEK
jgi:hypothetical protein